MTTTWPLANREAAKRAMERHARLKDQAKQPTREDSALWRASTRLALATKRPGLLDSILEGLPLTGDVDGHVTVPTAKVDDHRFGQSEGVPFVLEINVDRENAAPANVGHKVDQVFFQHYPPLLFNVCFSCGAPQGACRVGVYGDPRSRWFNVFFGYYQLDVKVADRPSPFGYDVDGEVVKDDVLRIGKSDWNYFSNWLYGVPESAIAPNNTLDGATVDVKKRGITIAERAWDVLTIDKAKMVSAYVSGKPGDAALESRGPYSFLWQGAFGFPTPLGKELPDLPSFFPCEMKARLYMCARKVEHDAFKGQEVFQTFLFGGTVNNWWAEKNGRHEENDEFLECQLEAVREVIKTSYPDLGFDP